MLVPGVRLIDRPGALHLFDGRRVVSLTGDEHVREALLAAIRGPEPGDTQVADADADERRRARADARELLAELRLIAADQGAAAAPAQPPATGPEAVAADYVSASTAGWVPAVRALRRLRQVTVHVLDDGDGLRASLRASGIRATSLADLNRIDQLDPARDIVVVVTPDGDPHEPLVRANAACVAAGVPLLPVGGYDGSRLHVGPLVVPGQSACVDCMLRRQAANVTYTELFDAVAAAPSAPTPAAVRHWSYSVATLALMRWIGDRDVRIPGRLFTIVPDEVQIRQCVVYRVPRCRVCAAPDYLVRAAPWESASDH